MAGTAPDIGARSRGAESGRGVGQSSRPAESGRGVGPRSRPPGSPVGQPRSSRQNRSRRITPRSPARPVWNGHPGPESGSGPTDRGHPRSIATPDTGFAMRYRAGGRGSSCFTVDPDRSVVRRRTSCERRSRRRGRRRGVSRTGPHSTGSRSWTTASMRHQPYGDPGGADLPPDRDRRVILDGRFGAAPQRPTEDPGPESEPMGRRPRPNGRRRRPADRGLGIRMRCRREHALGRPGV
jgi:hypothetical protein